MSEFSAFIDRNRQTGSTTSLVEQVIKRNGVLVVPDVSMRLFVLHKHPQLSQEQVLTLSQAADPTCTAGRAKRQVFVDASCLCALTSRSTAAIRDRV